MDTSSLPPHRTRRISLTKAQLRTELGAELLSLCESVTADGVLAPEEIQGLKDWLEDPAVNELPGATYLREVIEKVLADGKITGEECQEVYKAIEAVLPIEVRRQASTARRNLEAAQREEEKSVREKEREEARIAREKEREERRRNAPIASANFMVAGVRHEGRGEIISRYAKACEPVTLSRDRNNRFSRFAIAVLLQNGKQIGFVPEIDATDLAPRLDEGAKWTAWITKILGRGRAPIPVVQAYLYASDANVDVEEVSRSARAELRAAETGWDEEDDDSEEDADARPEVHPSLPVQQDKSFLASPRVWAWIAGTVVLLVLLFR